MIELKRYGKNVGSMGMIAVLFFFFFPVFGSAQEHIRILNWNDFHASNVASSMNDEKGSYYRGGAALLKGALDHFRHDSIPCIAIHAGDEFQGSPICTITKGGSQIRLLNLIKPDIFTLGNHEFDYGSAHLYSLLQKVEFPVISANLVNKNTNDLFVSPYKIIICGSIAIGLIGLMSPELPQLVLSTHIQDIVVLDPLEVIQKIVSELNPLVDIFIVVSHMGIDYDRKLAESTTLIDLVIGGHSHNALEKPEIVNGTIITQAGSYGLFLGKLDLWIDAKKDTIVHYKGKLLDVNSRNFSPNLSVQTIVDSLENIVADLGKVIAELKTDWVRNRDQESNIGNWISDAFREYTDADIALVNSGGIRKNLSKGPITKRDFWEIVPFSNYLMTFEATGREIYDIMESSVIGDLESLQVSGIKVLFDHQNKDKMLNISVGGNAINLDKVYSVATLDYLYDKMIKVQKIISDNRFKEKYAKLDREVLIEAAIKQRIISSKIEGRLSQKL